MRLITPSRLVDRRRRLSANVKDQNGIELVFVDAFGDIIRVEGDGVVGVCGGIGQGLLPKTLGVFGSLPSGCP